MPVLSPWKALWKSLVALWTSLGFLLNALCGIVGQLWQLAIFATIIALVVSVPFGIWLLYQDTHFSLDSSMKDPWNWEGPICKVYIEGRALITR